MNRRTPQLENTLLSGIEEGIPLRTLCRRSGIPRSTVQGWMRDPDFARRMAEARTIGFERIVDEILAIADDSSDDWVAREVGDDSAAGPRRTVMVFNPASVARAKALTDARLRVLACWYPRRAAGPGTGGARRP